MRDGKSAIGLANVGRSFRQKFAGKERVGGREGPKSSPTAIDIRFALKPQSPIIYRFSRIIFSTRSTDKRWHLNFEVRRRVVRAKEWTLDEREAMQNERLVHVQNVGERNPSPSSSSLCLSLFFLQRPFCIPPQIQAVKWLRAAEWAAGGEAGRG